MTIAKRLAALPAAALVGILLVSGLLLHDIGSVFKSASFAMDDTVPGLVVLQKMNANFIGVRLNVWQHVATPDAAGMAAAEQQMAGRRAKAQEALDAYGALAIDAADRKMLATDREAIVYYDAFKDKVLALSRAGRKSEAIGLLMTEKSKLAKASATLDEHIAYIVDVARRAHGAADATRRSAILWGLILMSATLVGVALLGTMIFRQVTRQLGGEPTEVADVANRVALGDFSSRIELRHGDTTSLMATVAKMRGDLERRTASEQARADAEHRRLQQELDAALENSRIRSALDGVSLPVTLVDTQGRIIYANTSMRDLMAKHAEVITRLAPALNPGNLVGAAFELFNAGAAGADDAARVRELLHGTSGARTTDLEFGAAKLRLTATAILDAKGTRLGSAVQWIDRTEEAGIEEEVATAVTRALEGDLTVRLSEADKHGFFLKLATGLNQLLGSLGEMIAGMSQAAGEVRTGADEISRGNMDLSQRTEQQASSLAETAASMEQMTSRVKSNADNAAAANQLASAAREQAERGGRVVGAAVVAMSGINDASRKIADIIGVIDEIAFQTNLLALNAAVEAARAGEQGRGFAVVASEVRSLASRSAAAAKEIKALIQDSVAKVSEGTRLVDESGNVLGEIVMGVKKVTDVMAEIAASSMEQASGIEQVNKAVTSMDGVTQQNAALVEQASAAAETLTEQAGRLASLIGRYRTLETDGVKATTGVERRGSNRPFNGKKPAAAPAPKATRAAAAGHEAWQAL